MKNRKFSGPLAALGIALLWGCNSRQSESESTDATRPSHLISVPATIGGRVYAQGQIQPAGGIVRIYSTPGDTIVELPVEIGTQVKAGDVLAVMRSAKAIEVQRKVLEEQKRVTQREQTAAVRQAQLRLSSAQLKLRQIEAQKSALVERANLIKLGEQQLAAAERMLESLENITRDSLTQEFVGQLEVERQRIAVDDARLKLAEQQVNHRQALTDVGLAEEAAAQEVEAAKAMLAMAEEADGVSLIDERLKALETEAAQAIVQSPSQGVVLALGAPVGGSAVQVPLVELADLNHIVCEAEVNVADASRIEPGQKVALSSPAFGKDKKLAGVVRQKSRLIGRPQLRSPDPLAAADYRTVPVIIELEDAKEASQWLQLQVEVVFTL